MGFDDAWDEFGRGRDDRGDGPRRKMNFLRVLVRCGGAFTGRSDGIEVPYDGAIGHAEELEMEGFIARASEQPIDNVIMWVPTEKGRRTC